jgi:transglutaminase-like putative cysteine protease
MFKNKAILFAFILFEVLVIIHGLAIIYVVFAESGVQFTNGMNLLQGATAVGVMMVVTIILNFFILALALTKLRTTSVFIPLGIASFLFLYFVVFSSGAFLSTLGPLFLGLVIGVYYAIMFFGPAMWVYFRFRAPFISVGWLSILYLSTILIANAIRIDSTDPSKFLSLLRPDYLIISGLFFFVASLLLIIDNTQAMARWKRLPSKVIGLPLTTIIPLIVILIVSVLVTNIASPAIWKVLWEESQQQGEQTNRDKTTEEQRPEDSKDGAAGNMKVEQNQDGSETVKMDPNSALQDKLNNGGEGQGNILFTVKVTDTYLDDNLVTKAPNGDRFYWKMEHLTEFNKKNGFHNVIDYDSNPDQFTLDSKWFDYFRNSDYIQRSKTLTQLYTFRDLESPWLIAHHSPTRIRLLVGKERNLYTTKNESILTQKNAPWKRGESYEVVSDVSRLNMSNASDEREVRLNYNRLSSSASDQRKEVQWNEITQKYGTLNDSKIQAFTQNLIGTRTNRVDIAIFINNYLKNNYSYTLEPGTPPNLKEETAGYDRLTYFLFENKQGYCTYYASGMVAMLRSIGIPARVVGGFAEGTYSPELQSYIVTGGDAHAWVEVFFNNYGWITFDPTGTSDEKEEQEQQSQEEKEKALTEEVKKQLEEDKKKAEETKKKFDNNEADTPVDPVTPPEVQQPEWLKNLTDQIMWVLAVWTRVLKFMMPFYIVIIAALAIGLPPLINMLIEWDLEGRFGTRNERESIIATFRLIERMLKKMDRKLTLQQGETALHYYTRVTATYQMDEVTKQSLLYACQAFNRAIFRHNLESFDVTASATALSNMRLWVDAHTSTVKKVFSMWWPN